jgi:antitoxin FitA
VGVDAACLHCWQCQQRIHCKQRKETPAMATLTIRDLDEDLKRSLRMRAASLNRSMEEEARQILRTALQGAAPAAADLATRIRARFQPLGDVALPIAEREPMRPAPAFDAKPRTTPPRSAARRRAP